MLEDGFPHLPVLGALDRAAVAGGEHEIVILPAIPRLETLRGLDLAVCLEEREQLGRALKGELALALSLAEDDAPAGAFRALVGVARTVLEAGPLEAGVPLLFAAGVMPMITALLFAGPVAPLLSAFMGIGTPVLPFGALDLEPRPDHSDLQVDVLPVEPERFALADAESQGDRPAPPVPPGAGHVEDVASLVGAMRTPRVKPQLKGPLLEAIRPLFAVNLR
ncbi:hypothetical protein ACSDR0_44430 [Streptosporangium sp. G11]|uniref:hypothetical protein n=1 Tax=Streptosporangium sp. G11 TaxID=3436926 RepID=UPI003EB784E3